MSKFKPLDALAIGFLLFLVIILSPIIIIGVSYDEYTRWRFRKANLNKYFLLYSHAQNANTFVKNNVIPVLQDDFIILSKRGKSRSDFINFLNVQLPPKLRLRENEIPLVQICYFQGKNSKFLVLDEYLKNGLAYNKSVSNNIKNVISKFMLSNK